MILKNNFKLTKTILLSIITIFSLISGVSCKVFETTCTPNAINESSGGETVLLSVTHGESCTLPQDFEIKIEFDNDVFKKSAKINYSDAINKNYRHNKSIFGNEISVKCSLKNAKNAPYVPENQEIFLITMESKKSIPKSQADFKITSEGDFGSEIQNISVRVEKSYSEKSSAVLTKLIPSQGNLSPNFNPNINEYSVNVPFDTKDIEFDIDSSNASGISINRHKLKAPGSETDIFITVKGEKRGEKNIYHISVSRDDKPDGENSKSKRNSRSTGPAALLKRIMPGRKSSKSSKNKSGKYDLSEDDISEDDNENSNSKVFREMEINQKENSDNNKGKLYTIIILSSVLCL